VEAASSSHHQLRKLKLLKTMDMKKYNTQSSFSTSSDSTLLATLAIVARCIPTSPPNADWVYQKPTMLKSGIIQ